MEDEALIELRVSDQHDRAGGQRPIHREILTDAQRAACESVLSNLEHPMARRVVLREVPDDRDALPSTEQHAQATEQPPLRGLEA